MTGRIFSETLGRGWRTMLYWGLGMGMYALLITVAVLDDAALKQISELLNSMPAFLMQGFMGSADLSFITSPNGYFAAKYFSIALLIFSAYAVMAGMAVTANDEDLGIMDGFLSLPLHRWSVIIGRGLAYMLMITVAVFITYLGVVIGSFFVPHVAYDLSGIAAGTLNMVPSLFFVLAMTVLFGVLFRRRSVALGVAAAVVVFSYTVDFIASGLGDSVLSKSGLLSFFHYYDGVGVMQDGLNFVNVGLLAAVGIVFAVLALWRFQKRDIGL
ncbi:MAG: ABC transporter permease subunit [Anaerolineae bacterium]